jgi:lactoylglutathione lyase
MTLNHINVAVPDVARSREFFETYFSLRCIAARGKNAIAVMTDDTGLVFSLSNFEHKSEVTYPSGFHIGFMQDSREQVDAMYDRLKAGGFEMDPPKEFHGAWTFYFHAPGGIVVEVGHQHKQPAVKG